MKKLVLLSLLFAVSAAFAAEDAVKVSPLPGANRPLKERFANPPADARILQIIHGMPDAPDEQKSKFESLVKKGFGGVVTNISFTDYLMSDEKWEAFKTGLKTAEGLGMSLWLYDERGYPSGVAGGLTLKDHPADEATGLHVADVETKGEAVELALPPGDLFKATALPVKDGAASLDGAVDLSSSISDGKIVWTPPEGTWRVFAITNGRLYEGTHAAVSLCDKLPYVNLVLQEPTARFIEVTHGEYARRLGDDLGKYFVATFTDEPSLMSLFMRPQNHKVLPWGANVSAEFQKRRGYSPEAELPALITDAGPKGKKFRYDYWQTIGELVSENYFGQIQTWCHAHNIPSGGHLLCEEAFLGDVPLYGNFFQCLRRLDAPSMDCLTSIPNEVPWFVARMIGSVADLEGRPITMSETSDFSQQYRSPGDERPKHDVTEAEIRGTCGREIINGINTITSYYSFTNLDDAQLNRLNEWIGRCCTMWRGGHQVTDFAMLYPVETAWTRFEPSRDWVKESPSDARRIERVFRETGDAMFFSRRDFTYIDARTLCEAKCEDGVLKLRDLQWRVVVLPDADTLPLAAWENLERFYETGGAIVALMSLPTNSETEFPSPRVGEIARNIFGDGSSPMVRTNEAGGAAVYLTPGSETLLESVLNALIETDGNVSGAGASIRIAHRFIDGAHVYFVLNDGTELWDGSLDLPADGALEQYDPATGSISALPSGKGVPLHLDAFSGMLFRCEKVVQPKRKQIAAGTMAGLETLLLLAVEPSVSNGEFVAGTVAADPDSSKPGAPVWRVSGTIKKGGVDCFQFARFEYPQGADLGAASYLVFDVDVKNASNKGPMLCVILRDAQGVEYIETMDVAMDDVGVHACFTQLKSFRIAGWCPIKDKPLDFSKITAISIGWGGYFGEENDEITFGLVNPRALTAMK
jgi:hypothetical protein